jgi:hypothetical protein
MKNLIILSLLLVFITSCSLERRLEKYCPLCTQKDSIVTITQIRDTTINIPGETVYIEDTLFCDSLGNVLSKLNGILRDKDGKIISLQTKLQNNIYTTKAVVQTVYKTIKGNDIIKTRVITKTLKPEKIKYIPSWINFLAWFGGIWLILIILYIVYRVLKSQVSML